MVNEPTTQVLGLDLWTCPGFDVLLTERQCEFNRGLVAKRERKRKRGDLGHAGPRAIGPGGLYSDEAEARRQVCTGCPGVRALAAGEKRVEPDQEPIHMGKKRPRVCDQCGGAYEGFSWWRFCSDKCNADFRRARRVTRTCVMCSREFSARHGSTRQTCASSCESDLRERNRLGQR